jgi:ribosomal protein S27E
MVKRKAPTETVKYTLLENGLDFIQHGLNEIADAKHPSELKYPVLHLGAGIELVLKERLRRVDWREIFSSPAKADKKAYAAGTFSSVNFRECLRRLQLAGVDVPAPSRVKLEAFYDRRNRIQHFRFSDTREAIESASAEVVSVLLDFIGAEFERESLDPSEQDILSEVRRRVADFRRFTETRMEQIRPKLKALKRGYGGIIQCPACLQETLSPDCEVECVFCGYRDTAESAADAYISNVVGYEGSWDPKEDVGPYPKYYCPECENEACVENEDGSFICFACGNTAEPGELRICGWCGEPAVAEDFCGERCLHCDNAYLAQDNT